MKSIWIGLVLALISSLTLSVGESRALEGMDSTTGSIEISPALDAVFVDGDDNKFREDWWMEEGLKGGVDNFTLRRDMGNDTTIEAKGRAIVPEEDYLLDLLIDKRDLGYVRVGYSEYRKYFDDTGGFFQAFSSNSFDLDKDLQLDIGKIFVEAGLTMPQMPKVILGYEHRFKDGEKSLLEWGEVRDADFRRKIYPSYKEIDEKVDVVRLEVSHEIANVQLGDEFRYESYRLDTKRHDQDQDERSDPFEISQETIEDDYDHDAFYNTLHAETHLNDKTFLSVGYLFTTLEGDSSYSIDTVPGIFQRDKFFDSRSIDLDQDVHIVSLNGVFGPFFDTTVYAGLEGEKLDTEGDTDVILTEVEGDDLPAAGGTGTIESPEALISSDKDQWGIEETLGVRYTGIPRTTIYAEGRWTQQDIDLEETEFEEGTLELLRDTDTRVRRQRYSIGFNSSPLPRTTVAARYRYSYRSNDYDHDEDRDANGKIEGYSAFILDQDFETNEVMAKVSFQPLPRIRTSLQYQLVAMDIDTDEDTDPPNSVHTTDYDANIYTASITATPYAGLFLTGLVSYQNVELETVDLADAPVTTYEGDVLSLGASAGLALDSQTHLNVRYAYTLTENFEDISEVGLPLGSENQRHAVLASLTRKITDNLSVKVRYGFYSYDDDASDGSDDYTAHLAGASLSMVF